MYCTTADVQSEFKNLQLDTTTAVSTADVSGFITQAEALVNSYAGNRYLLPIDSGSEGFQILKMISIAIVADRIRAIMEVKTSGKDAAQTVRRLMDSKAILQMLKDIYSGDIELVGGVALINNGSPLYSENVAQNVKPFFRMNKNQW